MCWVTFVCCALSEFALLSPVAVQQSIKSTALFVAFSAVPGLLSYLSPLTALGWIIYSTGEDELSGKFKVGQRDVDLALRHRRVSGLMSWPASLNGMGHHHCTPTKTLSRLHAASAPEPEGQEAGSSSLHFPPQVTCPHFLSVHAVVLQLRTLCSALIKELQYRAAFLALDVAHQYIRLPLTWCRVSKDTPKIQKVAH